VPEFPESGPQIKQSSQHGEIGDGELVCYIRLVARPTEGFQQAQAGSGAEELGSHPTNQVPRKQSLGTLVGRTKYRSAEIG